jgi:hypothetical protein
VPLPQIQMQNFHVNLADILWPLQEDMGLTRGQIIDMVTRTEPGNCVMCLKSGAKLYRSLDGEGVLLASYAWDTSDVEPYIRNVKEYQVS